MRKVLKSSSGFTLVELLVVIIIIGILATIGIMQFQQITETANRRADVSDIRSLSSAVQMLAMREGVSPDSDTFLDNEVFDDGRTVDNIDLDSDVWDYVDFKLDDADDPWPRMPESRLFSWENGRFREP